MANPTRFVLALLIFLCRCHEDVTAYYRSGGNPQSFAEGDVVKLKVNKMTSIHTLLPLDYYHLPFCRPEDGPRMDHENLGEILAGDRIQSSPYLLQMKKDMYCEQVCVSHLGRIELPGVSPNRVVEAIRKNYHNNWMVDNLPAASKIEDDEHVTTRYWQGFPVGFISEQDMKAYIHNHVNIEIGYHRVETESDRYRVVAFTVEPFSIRHDFEWADMNNILDEQRLSTMARIKNPIESCNTGMSMRSHTSYDMVVAPDQKPQEASGKVLFTYDVIWSERPDLHWTTRWDIYLTMDNAIPAEVHWFSIARSLIIVSVISTVVAILIRNLKRDINRYNKVGQDEEVRDEELEKYGWTQVHGDVFRPPSFAPMVLSVACGTGAQLLFMTLFTIIFAALGFMNPSRRGHLLMGEIGFFVLMGSVNGYVTARIYKTFKGKMRQWATATAALGLPGLAFGIFCIMNIVALAQQSSDAVPFTTMLTLVVLWFGISTPLVFLGSYIGYRQDAIEYPVSTSSIPRQIPDQPWFMSIVFSLAIGGILPFGSCFVELYYIMSSVWMGFYYYVFGVLLLVFVILLITCAEITVLFTYFQLSKEDYHWWWRSFCNGGSTAIYVFLYSFVYFKQLEANSLATYVLYFGYMALVSCGLFTMMGFIGLATSLWFNKTIFAFITVD